MIRKILITYPVSQKHSNKNRGQKQQYYEENKIGLRMNIIIIMSVYIIL